MPIISQRIKPTFFLEFHFLFKIRQNIFYKLFFTKSFHSILLSFKRISFIINILYRAQDVFVGKHLIHKMLGSTGGASSTEISPIVSCYILKVSKIISATLLSSMVFFKASFCIMKSKNLLSYIIFSPFLI